ncbi:hypothetical protein TREES_T100008302 [Tupaia chinensis]|uniref:Uncharacterized protein n=1 Tax=Tupaia chinensis TaxID=246437 RepID=L9LBG6_TUPCH|nr:hypothetical protein TREES_T100008302 [Tupaia chinensis]
MLWDSEKCAAFQDVGPPGTQQEDSVHRCHSSSEGLSHSFRPLGAVARSFRFRFRGPEYQSIDLGCVRKQKVNGGSGPALSRSTQSRVPSVVLATHWLGKS